MNRQHQPQSSADGFSAAHQLASSLRAQGESERDQDRATVVAWLSAELADDDVVAEAALHAAFSALPQPAPRPGLSARVLTQLALDPRPRLLVFGQGRAALARAAALLMVVAASLLALLLLPAIAPLLAVIELPNPLSTLTSLLSGFGVRLAAGLRLWETLSAIARGTSSLLVTPVGLQAALVALVVSVIALRLLQRLAGSERSTLHAPARISTVSA